MKQRILLAVFVCLSALGWAGGGPIVGKPIHHGRLTIFPITGPEVAVPGSFITLDEGLSSGVVKVGELGSLEPRIMRAPGTVPSSGQVNELALVNHSDRPLILLAGEVVSGGKQDRVVSQDRIVPPHSAPVPLGVFCVEPGRWRGLSMEFAAAKLMAHPELRKQAMAVQDQQKVWDEVGKSRAAMGVASGVAETVTVEASTSYARAAKSSPVEHKVAESVTVVLPQLPANAVGMVIAVDGRMVWADLFPNAALFRRYRDKLLQSYVVESYRAAASSIRPSTEEAADFLRNLAGRQNIQMEPGIYRLSRTESAGTVTFELEALGPNANSLLLHFARMVK